MKQKVKEWLKELYLIKHNIIKNNEESFRGNYYYLICTSAIKILKDYQKGKSLSIKELNRFVVYFGNNNITDIIKLFAYHYKVENCVILNTDLCIDDISFEYFANNKYFYDLLLKSIDKDVYKAEQLLFKDMPPDDTTLNGLNYLPLFVKNLNNISRFIIKVVGYNLVEYDSYIFRSNVLKSKQIYDLLDIEVFLKCNPACYVLCAFEGLHDYKTELMILDNFKIMDWNELQDINVFKHCIKEAKHYKFIQQNLLIE